MGYKIKEFRKKRKMSQEALAKKSGVCRATISALENGTERITSTKTLLSIARALDTTVDNIFFDDNV